jgi:hypothetical protein
LEYQYWSEPEETLETAAEEAVMIFGGKFLNFS